MENGHIPVMLNEVLEYLNPQPGQKFIDCTLGGGGYTAKIAEMVGKNGLVLGIDLDETAITNFKKNHPFKNVVLWNGSFRNIEAAAVAACPEVKAFDGIVMDLGLSSNQLADEERGFSFIGNRPLDMAFGSQSPRSTEKLLIVTVRLIWKVFFGNMAKRDLVGALPKIFV